MTVGGNHNPQEYLMSQLQKSADLLMNNALKKLDTYNKAKLAKLLQHRENNFNQVCRRALIRAADNITSLIPTE
jgi:hypothetical protein